MLFKIMIILFYVINLLMDPLNLQKLVIELYIVQHHEYMKIFHHSTYFALIMFCSLQEVQKWPSATITSPT